MKPTIRRHRTDSGDLGQGWDLTRPGFGFNSAAAVINYPSWAAARRALLSPAPANGSQHLQVEVAGYGPGLYWWSPRTPQWIEASGRGIT